MRSSNGGFLRGGVSGYLGKKAFHGELTDAQIADFYVRQACDGYGRQAIEELIRTEHKTPAEVLDILHSRGVAKKFKEEDFSMGNQVYDPQVKERVISERLKGISAKQIAGETGLSSKQVENIYTAHREKQKRQSKADAPEPEISADLPTVSVCEPEPVTSYKLSDCTIAGNGSVIKAPVSAQISPLNIFAVLLAMREFVNAITGSAEITEAAAAGADAHISFSFGGDNYGLEMKRLDS